MYFEKKGKKRFFAIQKTLSSEGMVKKEGKRKKIVNLCQHC